VILRALNGVILAACLAWLLLLHQGLVRYPHPMESGEGSMLLGARLLSQGSNPWDWQRQPQATNVYGAGYPLAAAALRPLFGLPSLLSLRALSALCILLICSLIYAASRRLGLDPLEALWISLLQYLCLLYYTSPLARPDALGSLLFLASIIIAWAWSSKPAAWYLSGILIALATLTKLYFALAAPMLALWLLSQWRWRELLRLAAGCCISAAAAVSIIARWGEAYPYTSFIICFGNQIYNSAPYARTQLWAYAKDFCLAFPLAGALFWIALSKGKAAASLPWILFACVSLLAFIMVLGGNFGSYMAYLYQFNLPFLLLALASLIAALGPKRPWMIWALALQMLIVARQVGVARPGQDAPTLQAWDTIEAEAAASKRVFAPWDLACWQVEHSRELQDAGHRAYFGYAMLAARRYPHWFPRADALQLQAKRVEEREDADLRAGAYDLVLLHRDDLIHKELLNGRYEWMGWLSLAYPQGKDFQVIEAYRLKPPAPVGRARS
jgi:hypothetical protein